MYNTTKSARSSFATVFADGNFGSPVNALVHRIPMTRLRNQNGLYGSGIVKLVQHTDPCDDTCVAPKSILVFYHGGIFGQGQRTTGTNTGTEAIMDLAVNEIQALGRTVVAILIAPGFTESAGVATGKEFIDTNYNSGDQIIIYGYSYGGDNAVNLAEAIKLPVDSMVIVDSSDGPLRGTTVQTVVTANVRVTFNVYQRETSRGSLRSGSTSSSESDSDNDSSSENSSSDGSSDSPGSRGFEHSAAGDNIVINEDVSGAGITHGNIQRTRRPIIWNFINGSIHEF